MSFYHYREQYKYLLHSFVVMPDHFHALITIGPEISIERAVQFIKGGFTFRAGKELGFRPPIWERGFSEVRVNDFEAAARVREYIEMNPVERQLVLCASGYPYCSAHPRFALDELSQGLKPRLREPLVGTSEDVPDTKPIFHTSEVLLRARPDTRLRVALPISWI